MDANKSLNKKWKYEYQPKEDEKIYQDLFRKVILNDKRSDTYTTYAAAQLKMRCWKDSPMYDFGSYKSGSRGEEWREKTYYPNLVDEVLGTQRNDVELRVLDDVRDFFVKSGVKGGEQGTLYIYVTTGPCTSCRRMIKRFQFDYPGIEVKIFYKGGSKGEKVWSVYRDLTQRVLMYGYENAQQIQTGMFYEYRYAMNDAEREEAMEERQRQRSETPFISLMKKKWEEWLNSDQTIVNKAPENMLEEFQNRYPLYRDIKKTQTATLLSMVAKWDEQTQKWKW